MEENDLTPEDVRVQKILSEIRRTEVPGYSKVTHDWHRLQGRPAIRDTPITVAMVVGHLAAGFTKEETLANFQMLEISDIEEAIEYARNAASHWTLGYNRKNEDPLLVYAIHDRLWQLSENSLLFFEEAISNFDRSQKQEERLLFAVTHLHTSLELMLKAGLMVYDWGLIFVKVKDTTVKNMLFDSFESINLSKSPNKLQNCLDLLPVDERSTKHDLLVSALKELQKNLEPFRKWRNAVEHFVPSINDVAIHSLTNSLIGTCLDLASWLTDILSENVSAMSASRIINHLDDARRKLGASDIVTDQRLEKVRMEIKKARGSNFLLLGCPLCKRKAMPVTGGLTACICCRKEYGWDEFAALWVGARAHEEDRFDLEIDLNGFDDMTHPLYLGPCKGCGTNYWNVNLSGLKHNDSGENSLCFHCGYFG